MKFDKGPDGSMAIGLEPDEARLLAEAYSTHIEDMEIDEETDYRLLFPQIADIDNGQLAVLVADDRAMFKQLLEEGAFVLGQHSRDLTNVAKSVKRIPGMHEADFDSGLSRDGEIARKMAETFREKLFADIQPEDFIVS